MARKRTASLLLALLLLSACGEGSSAGSADGEPLGSTAPNPTTDELSDNVWEELSDEVPDRLRDLAMAYRQPGLLGRWELSSAIPPAGDTAPQQMLGQFYLFTYDPASDVFRSQSEWACVSDLFSISAFSSDVPEFSLGEGMEGDGCTGSLAGGNPVWSEGIYPDIETAVVDGDVLTISNDEGWVFEFARTT